MAKQKTKVVRRQFLQSTGTAIGIGTLSNSASADTEPSWQTSLLGERRFTEVTITHDSSVHTTKKIPIGDYGVVGDELQLVFTDVEANEVFLNNNHVVKAGGFRPLPAEIEATPSRSVVVERNAGLKPTATLIVVSGYTPPTYRVLKKDDGTVTVESSTQTVTVPNNKEKNLKLPTQTVEIPGNAPSNPPPSEGIDVQEKVNKETNDSMLDDERFRNATEEARITPVLNIRNHGIVDVVDYQPGGGR